MSSFCSCDDTCPIEQDLNPLGDCESAQLEAHNVFETTLCINKPPAHQEVVESLLSEVDVLHLCDKECVV